MADKSASSHPPGASNAQKAMKVQMDIRNNADEVSSILGDLNKWEKKIAKKDADMLKRKAAAAPPVRVFLCLCASQCVPLRMSFTPPSY